MTRHASTVTPDLHVPQTVQEAVELLADGAFEVLAGGTWVMRGGIRGEGYADGYVLISKLPDLTRLGWSDQSLVIGAAVTHAQLATFLTGHTRLTGLATAAAKSANPAIRRAATVGGNLSTVDFPAADLVPALLALDAQVSILDVDGERVLDLVDYLASRTTLSPRTLLTHVTVTVPPGFTAQERLTMRSAGDYPVGIVSTNVRIGADGLVEDATIAVGSVEPVARLWPSLASALIGHPLDSAFAMRMAHDLKGEFNARDGIEAAGWYRLQVLPELVARTFRTLEREADLR
ncbi:MAG: FAD-binding molybdopterin dehydrogenase protein [Aeromicrobium sp.]|jgi:carbon-monoxide dehydrogenase medium subunit|nr:FAD-binding molybdopterin dehydrogenase protein [Aeromicrobium sp.]